MSQFFVTPDQVEKPYIYITGPDVNHMKNVLRMRMGERTEISDGGNRRYACQVESYEEDRAVLRILEEKEADTELPSEIWLFQGLPKGDKMEWIVQKSVELGVSHIVPLAARRCVVRLDEKKAEKKTARWNSISESAAKQAGRSRIPEVHPVMGWEEALNIAKALDVALIPYELAEGMQESRSLISQICPGQSVGIFIGPEGGFEKEEVERACAAGAKAVTLGRRILRTETAGLTVLSVLMFQLEQ